MYGCESCMDSHIHVHCISIIIFIKFLISRTLLLAVSRQNAPSRRAELAGRRQRCPNGNTVLARGTGVTIFDGFQPLNASVSAGGAVRTSRCLRDVGFGRRRGGILGFWAYGWSTASLPRLILVALPRNAAGTTGRYGALPAEFALFPSRAPFAHVERRRPTDIRPGAEGAPAAVFLGGRPERLKVFTCWAVVTAWVFAVPNHISGTRR